MTTAPEPCHAAAPTRSDACHDHGPDDEVLLERREAGIAVPVGLAVLSTLVCAAVLGSSPLALLMLVAVAGVAGLTAAAL